MRQQHHTAHLHHGAPTTMIIFCLEINMVRKYICKSKRGAKYSAETLKLIVNYMKNATMTAYGTSAVYNTIRDHLRSKGPKEQYIWSENRP